MQPALEYPRQFGKYLLVRPLASGGMAEVFLAQMSGPAGFDKVCVVKCVLPSYAANRQYMQMFLDESRVIARLSHPNVVQVFDMGQVGDDYFMAMEYIPGTDLQNLLDALPDGARRIPVPVACRIVAQVAEGLDHAHRAVDGAGMPLGIVHRDVSPSNIIISVDGVAKICDFGIAKFGAQASKTEVGSLKGKIHYMSPEQVRGDRLDGRSDLFSLGVLLYESTIGIRPFEGTGPTDIALKILNDQAAPPDLYVDGFPNELWAVIQCLLSKRATDRFSSARELQIAIDELLMAWAVRASSNEVAAYLESAMPGIAARTRVNTVIAAPVAEPIRGPSVGAGAGALAVGPTELRPFGEVMDVSFGDDGAAPSPVALDLSGPTLDGDRAPRNATRSSGLGAIGIALIVIAVGAGFYWLTRRADEQAATPPPATVTAPATAPATVAVPVAAPATVTATVTKPIVPGEPVVVPLPVAEKPPALTPTPVPVAAKHHSHAKHESHGDSAPHELPRLPTPPPTDDAP